MFRFLELELHGWDVWSPTRIRLDADVVILSGPNGSGKTTMLDAIRQILNAQRLSQNRRLAHYLRRPNQPALIRAVVSNRQDKRGRRPFETQRVFTDEATLACGLMPDGGSPEKRFAVLPGRPSCIELQSLLLEGREWLAPDLYRRVLERAGVSRSLMHILALEQGRADELTRKSPRDLFRWVMEARGTQQVLERYSAARTRFQGSLQEVERQRSQLNRQYDELKHLERLVGRLDDYESLLSRLAQAEALSVGARLQAKQIVARDMERRLPDLRTRVVSLTTTVERLGREAEQLELGLEPAEHTVAVVKDRFADATAHRDRRVEARTLARHHLEATQRAGTELQSIEKEDASLLRTQIDGARQRQFQAEQQARDCRDQVGVLTERISKLESGIPVLPDTVQATLTSLEQQGIACVLAATRIEITDPRWARAIESALGPLRFALCLAPEDLDRAAAIARRNGFPGPLVTESASQPVVVGPVYAAAGAPDWFADWLGRLNFSEADRWEAHGGRVLYVGGMRQDEYGAWVAEVATRVLGGSAIRTELEVARVEYADIVQRLALASESQRKNVAEVALLDVRLERQKRRAALVGEAGTLPAAQSALEEADRELAAAEEAWAGADDARLSAQRNLDDTKAQLKQTAAERGRQQRDLDLARSAVSKMDADLAPLIEEIRELADQATPEIRRSADAGELSISPEMAEHDVNETRARLGRFRDEEPLPEPTVRDEHKLTSRNIRESEQHVRAREREADAARSELDQCRGEYLQVILSVLHDYRRRAVALADIARAKLEVELPRLENNDKSIDEAGIVVRIGFDGKSPTEIGDTAHSGGQQVIAGLVLLMAMAETEGDSFFIVDEPFAHLSLDRIDEVGRFLRGSGSQFLITVPTTLDRGQLDPASLLVVLSKKKPGEAFAPPPVIARV